MNQQATAMETHLVKSVFTFHPGGGSWKNRGNAPSIPNVQNAIIKPVAELNKFSIPQISGENIRVVIMTDKMPKTRFAQDETENLATDAKNAFPDMPVDFATQSLLISDLMITRLPSRMSYRVRLRK